MSERTLKEKAERRRTQEGADQEYVDLQARGGAIKSKLDEVEELIDEALEENQEDAVADGARCACGYPLSECWRYGGTRPLSGLAQRLSLLMEARAKL